MQPHLSLSLHQPRGTGGVSVAHPLIAGFTGRTHEKSPPVFRCGTALVGADAGPARFMLERDAGPGLVLSQTQCWSEKSQGGPFFLRWGIGTLTPPPHTLRNLNVFFGSSSSSNARGGVGVRTIFH